MVVTEEICFVVITIFRAEKWNAANFYATRYAGWASFREEFVLQNIHKEITRLFRWEKGVNSKFFFQFSKYGKIVEVSKIRGTFFLNAKLCGKMNIFFENELDIFFFFFDNQQNLDMWKSCCKFTTRMVFAILG